MKYSNLLLIILVLGLSSCFSGYLDKKPDQKLVVPKTLNDLQALLDNINSDEMNTDPSLGFISSDDFYITDEGFSALTDIEQGAYLWEDDIYGTRVVIQDWARPYKQIFYSNVVLEGLANLAPAVSEYAQFDAVRGAALYFRGMAYYNLAQLFRKPYSKETAMTTPGLPVKLESDINVKPQMGNLQETYDQLISDLNASLDVLPLNSDIKSRPDKKAAHAMLARTYLTMGLYDLAETHANEVLSVYSKLLDYNILQTDSNRPFPASLPNRNEEVIFHSVLYGGYSYIGNSLVSVDTSLYESYERNDLRKYLFFRNRGNNIYTFKGTYSPSLPGNPFAFFSGLATDEMYLIRAECRARSGKELLALNDLNTLLSSRWVRGTYIPLENLKSSDLITKILSERRKELVGRGLRWSDLRRLNKTELFVTEIYRNINGKKYVLFPQSSGYTFSIPKSESFE